MRRASQRRTNETLTAGADLAANSEENKLESVIRELLMGFGIVAILVLTVFLIMAFWEDEDPR